MTAAQIRAMHEQAEARELELARDLMRTDAFIDFQPRCSPHLSRRPDLAPIFDIFERAYAAAHGRGRPVIALVSAPPQVGKTLAGQHCFAGWLARDPSQWLAFITYNTDLAETKSRDVRDFAKRAGVAIRTDSSAVSRWQTEAGGGLLARGRDGGITGQSALACIWLDDPYKDRIEAESAAISESIAETVSGVIMTRRHPFTSVVISHTRWTTNDVIATTRAKLAGRIEGLGVDLVDVNIPCVDEVTGEPLITFGGRDRAFYEQQRLLVTDHDWWSLFMGAPRAREGRMFRGTHYYDALPGRYSVSLGMDLAYSAKKSADWSVLVALARDLTGDPQRPPTFYVLDVLRMRCEIGEWVREAKRFAARWPGASIGMRTGGQESALLDVLRSTHGLLVEHEPTRGDKVQNALALADAWREGRVLLPQGAPWVGGLVGRALDFAGADTDEDDEIDAMVTAHKRSVSTAWMNDGGPLWRPAGSVAKARGGWM